MPLHVPMKKHVLLSQVAYIHVEQRMKKRKRMPEIMQRPLNVADKILAGG